jgi:hypothetical protein
MPPGNPSGHPSGEAEQISGDWRVPCSSDDLLHVGASIDERTVLPSLVLSGL